MKIFVLLFCLLINLSFANAQDTFKIYDSDWNLKYYSEGSKVYDSDWDLKYRIENGKVYDKDWNLKYYLKDKVKGKKETNKDGR